MFISHFLSARKGSYHKQTAVNALSLVTLFHHHHYTQIAACTPVSRYMSGRVRRTTDSHSYSLFSMGRTELFSWLFCHLLVKRIIYIFMSRAFAVSYLDVSQFPMKRNFKLQIFRCLDNFFILLECVLDYFRFGVLSHVPANFHVCLLIKVFLGKHNTTRTIININSWLKTIFRRTVYFLSLKFFVWCSKPFPTIKEM